MGVFHKSHRHLGVCPLTINRTPHVLRPAPLRRLAGPRVEVDVLATVRGEVQAAGYELSIGDHVRVSGAPCNLAGVAQGNRFQFSLKKHMVKARRRKHCQHRRARTI